MNKLLLTFACLSLVFVNPAFAHNCANEAKHNEQQVQACCKDKGGAENCCKKDLSVEKKQCTKKDCKGACCSKVSDTTAKTQCSKSKCDKSNCDKAQCDKSKCDKSKCDKSKCDKTNCDKSKCEKSCNKGSIDTKKKSWWKIW